MQITQAQFNKLNEIALVLVCKIDTKMYREMFQLLIDIQSTNIEEIEECAKEIPVDSIVEMYHKLPEEAKERLAKDPQITCEDDSVCPRDYDPLRIYGCGVHCTIRGMHKHTEAF